MTALKSTRNSRVPNVQIPKPSPSLLNPLLVLDMAKILRKPILKQLHRSLNSTEILDAAVPSNPSELRLDWCGFRGSVGAFGWENDDFVDEIREALVCEFSLFTKREFF